jgi:hypothetical protein
MVWVALTIASSLSMVSIEERRVRESQAQAFVGRLICP